MLLELLLDKDTLFLKSQWGIEKERTSVFHFIKQNAILEENVISL